MRGREGVLAWSRPAAGAAAAILTLSGDGGDDVVTVQPGPITSFDDIAGTYLRGPGHSPIYVQFSEDGTWHASSNRDLVEDALGGTHIYQTRFEGTKIFLTETKGFCDDDPEAIYEIHMLENGSLEVVAVEDPCAHRSSDFFQAEWEPVP